MPLCNVDGEEKFRDLTLQMFPVSILNDDTWIKTKCLKRLKSNLLIYIRQSLGRCSPPSSSIWMKHGRFSLKPVRITGSWAEKEQVKIVISLFTIKQTSYDHQNPWFCHIWELNIHAQKQKERQARASGGRRQPARSRSNWARAEGTPGLPQQLPSWQLLCAQKPTKPWHFQINKLPPKARETQVRQMAASFELKCYIK